MKELFYHIVDMSVAASWLVLAVVLMRLLLRRAPRYIHCILWGMVALRLLCPTMPQSEVSLIPDSKPVSSVVQPGQSFHPTISAPEFDFAPLPTESVDLPPAVTNDAKDQSITWQDVLPVIWVAGVGLMTCYGFASYFLLRRRVAASVKDGEAWLCDDIASPFILGIFRPRIYLPSGLEHAHRESVLAHERSHLMRKDHWWKPIGFVLLIIHWFNPVIWLGYILLCRDIESACDERVVRGMDTDARKAYSEALLSCAAPRRSLAACPLAFGEQGVKGRIKSVLNYKKPAFWILIVAILTSAAVAVCFLTNPKDKDDLPDVTTEPSVESTTEPMKPEQAYHELLITDNMMDLYQKVPSYFITIGKGAEVYVWEQEGSLYCGAMPGTNRYKTDEEIQSLIGIPLETMAIILDSYTIPDWHVFVIPIGESKHWPDGVTNQNNPHIKLLRDQLGLYTVEQGDITISLSDISFIDRENGCFLADGGDGIYRVNCSDMTGLDIGYNVGVVYDQRREASGTEYDYEINAIHCHVTFEINRRVVFSLFDEPAVEGQRFSKPLTHYYTYVTYEEYTALQAMMKPAKWYDPQKLDRQFVYSGIITIWENRTLDFASSSIASTSKKMYFGDGFLNNGYAVGWITEEHQALLEKLIGRAEKLNLIDTRTDKLSGEYLSNEHGDWVGPWIHFSKEEVQCGTSHLSSKMYLGRVTYEGNRVTVTLNEGGTMVFEIVERTLIYDAKASNQDYFDLEDGYVLYKQI